jgi:hypothetical protein
MTLIYPNIGPARLLSKFVLEGDKAARGVGIRLRLRHDFDELLYLNKQEVANGRWFKLVNMFNPSYCDLSPEDSYWISGEDKDGEIVLTQAGRIYYWPETTLEEEARSMFYAGHDEGQICQVTAPAAKSITGVVFCAGSHWIRPDFRGMRLSHLLARLGRAYAVARWPVDWGIALVAPILVEKEVSSGYGYRHASYSIFYPKSPWGELEVVLAYLSAIEAHEDLAGYLDTELSGSESDGSMSRSPRSPRDERVTRISSEGVFHGNNNRS